MGDAGTPGPAPDGAAPGPESSSGEEALAQVEALLAGLVDAAMASTRTRCPYKNRVGECTAAFGCRNKRKPEVAGDPMVCSAPDGALDYRSAWETE